MMQATAAAGEAAIKEVFEEQATKPRLHPRIGLRAEYRVLERWSSGAAGSSSFTDDSSQ
jgi:hypothetical protein